MEVKVQDGDTINIPHGLKPIIKDTYITFKKQPIFKWDIGQLNKIYSFIFKNI